MNDLQIAVFAFMSLPLSFYWLFNIKEKQLVPSLVPFLLQVMKKAQSWKKRNNLTAQALFFCLRLCCGVAQPLEEKENRRTSGCNQQQFGSKKLRENSRE